MAVHANWHDRSLLLWGGASAAELRELLGQISSDETLLASVAQEATLRIWLPTEGRLEAADVLALRFSPAEAVDLLLSLAEPLPAECGDSVRYWVALARFVTDCIRREKFFPAVRRPNAHHEAVWRLHLPSAEELDRLERFANAMPPSCRAVVGEESLPLGLIDSFLTETTDALVRRAVSNDPFFTRVHGMAAERGAGPEMRLLSALLASDRTIPGELRENEVLADQVHLWTSRLGGAAPATGWQLAFTLHEPPDDVENPEQATWRVTFRLQPLGDGKPLDAATLWEDHSPLSPLGRQLPELRGLLTAELTRAAEVFAPLARVLSSPAPSEIELSTAEANQFLRQWSAELRARSFAVELPSWAEDSERRLSLVMALRPFDEPGEAGAGAGGGGRGTGFAAAAAAGPSRMGLDSLLEFDWRISLGGMDLSPDEFDVLVRRQSPLVKVRGRWVELEADLAAAALELMEKQRAGQTTLGDAFRAAFATTRADGAAGGRAAPAVALSGTAWVKDLLDQLPAMRAQEIPQPESFKGTLRPYQLRGLQWLSFLDRLGIGGCLADDMGLGKAQPLDANILTPTGWRRMGDLSVGDEVIGSSGTPARVTGVYPQGSKGVFRVIFSDGSSTECCDDHLWYVNTPVRRYRNAPGRVLPLREIRSTLRDSSGNARHIIPMVQPVEFEPRPLPLHPYLLGVLLGDGGIAHRVIVSSADAEIIDRVAALLPDGASIVHTGCGVDYRIRGERPGGENALMDVLRRLELMGRRSHEKFVPALYKFAPVADRLELLRGLLDTDGRVRPVDNNIEFCTTSPRLAEDVKFLVQSLGGTAPVRQKRTSGRTAYRMSIALPGDIQPFWLERKARVYHPRAKYPPARAIVAVEPVGEKPVQCIAVDAPDHLYVTDDFVVTHNTIQLIALLLHERAGSEGQLGPTLLFAPTSVVGNWVKELERFAPEMRVLLHHGPQRSKAEEFSLAAQQSDVVITSYALAHRDRDDLAKVRWHRLALDEAQKIKNPSAASSVAIRSLSAPRRVALTGTPIENHLSELWSIMDVLNPGLLGSARDFRERFAVPIEKLLDRDRGEHLRRMIRPFVLRRTKTDPEVAGDLPDKIEMKVFCNLTPEQAAMYERATAEMLGQIDAASGIRRRGLILAVLTRLKQICDHPALLADEAENGAILDRRSGKCERLVEMLEEVLDEGESALVFTQYAQMGTLLQRVLKDRLKSEVFYLHGGTPQKQRDDMVAAFQEAKAPSIFILSLRAGGLGLNLTAANHVFHFDRWWNPAVENQATDRAHRIGQKRSVQVHKFIAVGTVEERIDRLLTEKTQLAESIVGGGDEWLTDLSTAELREYLRLSDEAVGEF